MPVKKGTSLLAAKLGGKYRKAVAAHKDDETKYSAGGQLPPNVVGIARLSECKFSEYEKGEFKGEPFYMAVGIVMEPEAYQGMRTQVGPEPVCDTPRYASKKTAEDHIAFVLNELRKLGLDTSELDEDDPDLESCVEALKESKPYFKFRTWASDPTKAYPNPRTNHDWRGVCEYDDDSNPASAVEDNTEDEEEEAEEEEDDSTGEVDLDDLAEKADADDEDAQAELEALAKAAGVNAKKYDTWAEVVEAMEAKGGDDEEEAEEAEPEETDEAEDEEIEKGQVVYYKPPKAKKAVECEVTGVVRAKQLANLKSLDNGHSWKAVPWAKLTSE